LENVDVVFSRLGCVAGEQEELEPDGSINSKENLESIYQAAIEVMGGTVLYIDKTEPNPEEMNSVDTMYSVTPTWFIPVVPEGTSPPPLEIPVHFGESVLGFIPDTAEFQDRTAAIQALAGIAEIVNDSGQSIRILGYQALPPGGTVGELPELRAKAVQDILINDLGVDPAQIVEARGNGEGKFANPYDENGNWDTDIAQANRVVVIEPA
jgi:hypothetical protein